MGKQDKGIDTLLGGSLDNEGRGEYTVMGLGGSGRLFELAAQYQREYPGRQVQMRQNIAQDPNVVSEFCSSYEKLNLEFRMAMRLVPEVVKNRLYEEKQEGKVHFDVSDGMGSKYDSITSTLVLKGAQDFIHEIGHHLWNNWLIKPGEERKKKAVNNSLSDDCSSRIALREGLIPDLHKDYARLVGAYNGQFLENPDQTQMGTRMNDLEEHFARNFDLLCRSRPLDVTAKSKTNVRQMVDFYVEKGLLDVVHSRLYRQMIFRQHGELLVNRVMDLSQARDGFPLRRDELFRYHKCRIEVENRRTLNINEEIGLALDLSPHFVTYCVENEGFSAIKDALQEKGVTAIKL